MASRPTVTDQPKTDSADRDERTRPIVAETGSVTVTNQVSSSGQNGQTFGQRSGDRERGRDSFGNRGGGGNATMDKDDRRTGGRVERARSPTRGREESNSRGSFAFNMPILVKDETTGLMKKKVPQRNTRIFVGNIAPDDYQPEEFKRMFERFGEIQELFMNPQKGFAFVRYYKRDAYEAAKEQLDGYQKDAGKKPLRLRPAAHPAVLKVRNLPEHVTNELLESAMAMFGEVERARVVVDEKGRPTGDGFVEFSKKWFMQRAFTELSDGVFLLTADVQPVIVEQVVVTDEDDGLQERWINKQLHEYEAAHSLAPRFAEASSFELEFGQKWKQLYAWEAEQKRKLEQQMNEYKQKLLVETEEAMQDYQTHMLREELRRKEEQLKRMEEASQRRRHRPMDGPFGDIFQGPPAARGPPSNPPWPFGSVGVGPDGNSSRDHDSRPFNLLTGGTGPPGRSRELPSHSVHPAFELSGGPVGGAGVHPMRPADGPPVVELHDRHPAGAGIAVSSAASGPPNEPPRLIDSSEMTESVGDLLRRINSSEGALKQQSQQRVASSTSCQPPREHINPPGVGPAGAGHRVGPAAGGRGGPMFGPQHRGRGRAGGPPFGYRPY